MSVATVARRPVGSLRIVPPLPPITDAVVSRSVTVPAAAFPRRAPSALLLAAREGLSEAGRAARPGDRYSLAHVAALRVAAAVLAARARPGKPKRGSTSAWALLTVVAPELNEWAAFFAAGARKRAAAEAGQPNAVSDRDADDLVRDAGRFLEVVESMLGAAPVLPLSSAG